MKNGEKIIELNQRAWDKIANNHEENRPKWLEEKNPLFKFFLSKFTKWRKYIRYWFWDGIAISIIPYR